MTDVATRVRTAAVSLRGAALRFGERTLWEGLDLDVAPGDPVHEPIGFRELEAG